ncbi:MAG: nucleotidyltransferase domain-containing protein [Polyangiaceae bacterium]
MSPTNAIGLSPGELASLRSVFARHPEIEEVFLFGSRAMGNHRPESDIDLAVRGIDDERAVEALADELPLPFLFDVKSLGGIQNPALLEHVRRVGRSIYAR